MISGIIKVEVRVISRSRDLEYSRYHKNLHCLKENDENRIILKKRINQLCSVFLLRCAHDATPPVNLTLQSLENRALHAHPTGYSLICQAILCKVLYREAPPRCPAPCSFVHHFDRKGTPFAYLSLKRYLFHVLSKPARIKVLVNEDTCCGHIVAHVVSWAAQRRFHSENASNVFRSHYAEGI